MKLKKEASEDALLNHSVLKEIPSKCMEMWKLVPRCFIRQQYSLLELTQKIIECSETTNCGLKITEFSSTSSQKLFDEICKPIENVISKSQERSYLLSDGYQFLTEKFHIRLAYLKDCYREHLGYAKGSSFNEYIRNDFEKSCIFIKQEINELLIKLCSLALRCRNIHINNVE